MSTRVEYSFVNWTGQTTPNGLHVERLVRRTPPMWAVRCVRCNAETNEPHSRIEYATCKNSACGKPTPKRRELDDERKEAARRETERLAEEREVSARRMAAETEDYERPERYAPKASEHRVMTERERRSLREFREAEDAARLEAERPRLEAERRAAKEQAERERREQERKEKQVAYWRDAVLTGPDPQFVIDPATTIPIANSQVDAYHKAEMAKFLANNPSYHRCDENARAVNDYLERNCPTLKLVSAVQLEKAVNRLSALGLLKERPAPEPQPAPAPKRTVAPVPSQPEDEPNVEHGWDWQTGQPITLTRRQVALLSATDYRRFKKLDKAALVFPNPGPEV